jgi:hypothetical protein
VDESCSVRKQARAPSKRKSFRPRHQHRFSSTAELFSPYFFDFADCREEGFSSLALAKAGTKTPYTTATKKSRMKILPLFVYLMQRIADQDREDSTIHARMMCRTSGKKVPTAEGCLLHGIPYALLHYTVSLVCESHLRTRPIKKLLQESRKVFIVKEWITFDLPTILSADSSLPLQHRVSLQQ